jgi:hypothetical protein
MSPTADLPPLGFIVVELSFHIPPGDSWSERTWPFPTIKRSAKGRGCDSFVTKDSYPSDFIEPLIEAENGLQTRDVLDQERAVGFSP